MCFLESLGIAVFLIEKVIPCASRYLYKNMEKIQDRRAEVKKLKEQVTVLQQKLER